MRTYTSSISVRRETKKILERLKRLYEIKQGRTLTWDEFLLLIIPQAHDLVRESVLELSDEEADFLHKIVVEGRKSWRRRVSIQTY